MRDLNVDLFGLGCFFVSFWAKDEIFVGDIWDCPSYWDHCNCSLISLCYCHFLHRKRFCYFFSNVDLFGLGCFFVNF